MNDRTLAMERTGAEPDRGSMAELYTRHVPAAIRLAYLLTGDRQQAEDLAHDAFVRCVGRFSHLRAHQAFHAYLRRAIVNLHTSGLRRLRLEREWLHGEGARRARTAESLPDVSGGRICGVRSRPRRHGSGRPSCSATTKT
jgi:RNA polymerase sigma factor (sigma-70 family)